MLRNAFIILVMLTWFSCFSGELFSADSTLTLVHAGRGSATIVIPDKPLPVHHFAAEELQYHVERSSGVTLPIRREAELKKAGSARVYLGPCRHTQQQGITTEGLQPNGFLIKLVNGELFLLGNDSDGQVLKSRDHVSLHNNRTRVGTLFAVYEFLERELGVRWLWPGQLGEVIPKQATIVVNRWDEKPRSPLLHIRWRDYGFRYRAKWASQSAVRQYALDVTRWMRRQRAALGVDIDAGHAYTDWWKRYGKEHPEWFALKPNGQRGPGGRPVFVQMCVSQPGLWKEIVARHGDGKSLIDVSENDSDGSTPTCTCAACRAWDGPDGHLSDRYARFWLAVQREADKKHPGAMLATMAYGAYNQPPKDIKLNDRIIIGIVPGFYFPWSDSNRQKFRQQWQGWSDTGARLFLRPNWLHFGHNYPFNYARKLGEDFRFAHQRGMIGTDFDLALAPWANQGPTYYLLARIHSHPDQPIDQILQEYYDGFGPAAKHVRDYFEHWEHLTDAITAEHYEKGHLARGIVSNAEHKLYLWGSYFFTPDVMARGKKRLDAATVATMNDPVARRRIGFLKMGFRDIELTLATQKCFEQYKKGADPSIYVEALARLDAHRAAIEPYNVTMTGSLQRKETGWSRKAARELLRVAPGRAK